jgi:hypothetical protein
MQDAGIVDESGRFQLRALNGAVLFRTSGQLWNLKSVTLNGTDITDVPFDARTSSSGSGLEIVLTDRQTDFSGIVKNSRGETVKDFVVVVYPAVVKDAFSSLFSTRALRPDQDGRYQAKGLPAGDYIAVAVGALEQGGEWDPTFQQQAKPHGRAFRLTDTQPLTLDLTLVE